MHGTFRRARGRLALGALALFAVAGGVAFASIPDASGMIHGCYRTSLDDQKGQLRVVEDPASCRSNETAIQWNEHGTQGPPGQAGADQRVSRRHFQSRRAPHHHHRRHRRNDYFGDRPYDCAE